MHVIDLSSTTKTKAPVRVNEYTYRYQKTEWELSHTLPTLYQGDDVKAWLNEAGFPINHNTDYESFSVYNTHLKALTIVSSR